MMLPISRDASISKKAGHLTNNPGQVNKYLFFPVTSLISSSDLSFPFQFISNFSGQVNKDGKAGEFIKNFPGQVISLDIAGQVLNFNWL